MISLSCVKFLPGCETINLLWNASYQVPLKRWVGKGGWSLLTQPFWPHSFDSSLLSPNKGKWLCKKQVEGRHIRYRHWYVWLRIDTETSGSPGRSFLDLPGGARDWMSDICPAKDMCCMTELWPGLSPQAMRPFYPHLLLVPKLLLFSPALIMG